MRRLVFLTAVLLTACSGESSRRGIVLGIAGPFSQPRGVSMQRAAELAVKEINAHGGVHGQSVALRAMDDSGRPDVAIRIAQSFADDPSVVAVIGHLTSGASLAPGRVYCEARPPIVMISPSPSSPHPSGVHPSVFRVRPRDLSHRAP